MARERECCYARVDEIFAMIMTKDSTVRIGYLLFRSGVGLLVVVVWSSLR